MDEVGQLVRNLGELSLDGCKGLYQKAIEELRESNGVYYVEFFNDRIIPLWLKMWHIIASDDESRVYPLFRSTEVTQFLEIVAWNATVLEMRKPGLTLANGNSLLLTGPRGVGKTTLLYGAYCVTKSLCDKVVPVYHDYETGGFEVPKQLVARAAGINGELDEADPWVQCAYVKGHAIAFFGDEIQQLYVSNSSNTPEKRALGDTILRQILAIGKNGNAFGVLSGSARNVAALAFNKDPRSEFANFPNLNDTVYRELPVKPFRTKDDLTAMLKERFGNSRDWLDDDVKRCFLTTGGVGRLIETWTSPPTLDLPPLKIPFLELLAGDEIFFHVASELHSKNSAHIADDPFSQFSMSASEIKDIFERYGQKTEWLGSVERWIDESVIIEVQNGMYQLLIPKSYDWMSQLLEEPSEQLFFNCLKVVLKGYNKEGSPGGVVEKRIRQLIPDHSHELGLQELKYSTRALSFAKKASTETVVSSEDLKSMDEITEELFKLTKDPGVDGVVFFKDGNGYEVHVFQVKFGERGKTITAGNYPQGSDKYAIGEIIRNANRAAENIDKNLRRVLGETTLVFKSLTLITSKVVDKKAIRVMKKWDCRLNKCKVQFNIVAKLQTEKWLGEQILNRVGGL